MTDNELDQLMQRVLLDAIKSDCEKENSVVPSFEPSLRYQRSLAAMISEYTAWRCSNEQGCRSCVWGDGD